MLRKVKIAVLLLCLAIPGASYGAELVLVALMSSSFGDSSTPFWSIGEASPEGKKQIERLASSVGVAIDTRDRVDVLADMRKHRIDAVPAIEIGSLLENPTRSRAVDIDRLLPIGGISNSVTLLCNESGQYVTYESDEHGFRNPRGIWNASRADVAVVGQSFVQAYCVPDGKGFVDLLSREYPVVFNLGISGQGALLQLGAIKEFLPRYAPKIVLWVFQEGIDLADLREEVKHPLSMRYLEPDFSQHLLTRQVEIDGALRRFASDTETAGRAAREDVKRSSFGDEALGIVKLWHLRKWLADTRAEDDARAVAFLRESHERPLRDILQLARDSTSSWGGTLYFVYLPSWSRYRHNARPTEQERTTVLSLVDALHIPYIDVHPAFQAQGDPLSLFPFRRFGHYNEKGNRVVADTILTALRAQD